MELNVIAPGAPSLVDEEEFERSLLWGEADVDASRSLGAHRADPALELLMACAIG